MFCSSKEQETCRVEKRGCKGCFYMNEKEIINRIKYRINELKLNYAIDNLDLEAMQGLLDLYNQEKEKNKKLEEELNDYKLAIQEYKEVEKRIVEEIDNITGSYKEQLKEQSMAMAELEEQLEES